MRVYTNTTKPPAKLAVEETGLHTGESVTDFIKVEMERT